MSSAMQNALRRIDEMLREARDQQSFGEITIQLRNGCPVLVKRTIAEKTIEEEPHVQRRNG